MQRYHTPDKDQCAWKEKCFSVPRPAFNKKITMVLFVLRSMSKLLLKMYLVPLGAEDSPHTSRKDPGVVVSALLPAALHTHVGNWLSVAMKSGPLTFTPVK